MSLIFASIKKMFRTKSAGIQSQDFYLAGQNGDATVDLQGNVWTRAAVVPASGADYYTYQAVPGNSGDVINGAPNILTQVGGFNDSAANIYVQLHNRLAVIAGDAPTMTFFVPINASFSWTPSREGRYFSVGLTYVVSSTRNTYTALATNIFLFAEGYNLD